jgi:hypothetical protein
MKTRPHALALAAALPLLLQANLLDASERLLRASNVLISDSSTVTTTGQVESDSLVALVSSRLGITEQQSAGGLGALFNTARGQLSSGDFAQIANAVPEMNELLAAAPATEQSNSLLGRAGSLGNALNSAGQLKSAFDQLGLSSDMIAPIANIAVQYLESSSPAAANLLKQATGVLR